METLILQTKSKKESRLIKELLAKMNVYVRSLSKQEKEDLIFSKLIDDAIKGGESKQSSFETLTCSFYNNGLRK